ncbi:hypothetical protein MPRM_34270 [Mycobacterium parmense]|uniref:Uncharacterized protein n=1 Tax=Mycobacterium parmense TaxID=185642 RepID=A0A7I7YWE8_9MYCO|nr:hypothetical protein MPRM_34270 [Mycobacterium parmense]
MVGLVGAIDEPGAGLLVGGGDDDGRGVGNVGSVGPPAPGDATGLPSMLELQPDTGMALTSTGDSSNDPPAMPHRAFCDNRT